MYAAENEAADADAPAIPPGQEELLVEMLGRGATLPDGCRLANGEVEYTVVKATYTCPGSEVVLTLAHASHAAPAATQTRHFVVTVQSGSPPESLVDAVAALVASREDGFEWTFPAGQDPEVVDGNAGDDE